MITAVWIAQGLLAFAFLMAGAMKLAQTREKVIASGGAWAADFSDQSIKIIGVVEVLAAIGIIAPRLLGHGHYLTSISATVIAILMLGRAYTHIRRKEFPFVGVTLVLMALAIFVGYYTCPGIPR